MPRSHRLPNRHIAHLFTSNDAHEVLKDSVLKVENKDNWFDVMQYSGLKIPRKHQGARTRSRVSRSRAQSLGQKTDDTSFSGWDHSRLSEDEIQIPRVNVGAIRFFHFGRSKSMKQKQDTTQALKQKNGSYIKLDELENVIPDPPLNSKVSFLEDPPSQTNRLAQSSQELPDPGIGTKKTTMSEIFGNRRRMLHSGKTLSGSNNREDSALNRCLNSATPARFAKDLKLSRTELESANAAPQQKQKLSTTGGSFNVKGSHGMRSTRLTLAESRAKTAGIKMREESSLGTRAKSGFLSSPHVAQNTITEDKKESSQVHSKNDLKSGAQPDSAKPSTLRKSIMLMEDRRSSLATHTKVSGTQESRLRNRLGSINSQPSGGKSKSMNPQHRVFDELRTSFGVNDLSITAANISINSKADLDQSKTFIDELDYIDMDKHEEIIQQDWRKNKRDQFNGQAEHSLRLGLDVTNHTEAINEVIKTGNPDKARLRGVSIPKASGEQPKAKKKAWNRQSLMALTSKAHPFESNQMADVNKEDLNSKEKPRSGAHIIDSSSTAYWDKVNVLVVGFLNREILTYGIENDRGTVDIAIKRYEEIELEEVCTEMYISASIYSDKDHFLMMTFNFTRVRIYHIPNSATANNFLTSTVTKRNQAFEQQFTGLPRIHYCMVI